MASELAQELWSLRMAGSLADLTRRYRRLCKLHHPDVQQPGDRLLAERRMQLINEAYTEALTRFNIYTYRNPKQDAPPIHEELLRDPPGRGHGRGFGSGWASQGAWAHTPPPRTQSPPRSAPNSAPPRPPQPGPGPGYNILAAGAIGSALAVLKRTRTFFSMHGTDDPGERKLYVEALELLQGVLDRFPGTLEAQDALYYMGIATCNLKEYAAGIALFAMYRKRYPQDARSGLFHFYAGLCHHRLGNFAQAVDEYGWFLLSQGSAQYRHFAALVASYKEAAQAQVVPQALPYG